MITDFLMEFDYVLPKWPDAAGVDQITWAGRYDPAELLGTLGSNIVRVCAPDAVIQEMKSSGQFIAWNDVLEVVDAI